MDQQDELIFGKNAVLAYLEQACQAQPEPEEQQEVVEALAKMRTQVDLGDRGPIDLKQLKRMSKVKINKILMASGYRPDPRLDRIQDLARKNKIPVQSVERRKLDQIAGPERRHQGVVAMISPAELWSLDSFLQKLELDRVEREVAGKNMDGYVVALLDGIEDPHNLGAIIRVAEAAGVKGVLIAQHRSAGLTGTVAKISAGAVANLPVVRVSNLVQALEVFKKYGFWVAGLDADAKQVYTSADLVRPLIVVIGSEGKGMGRLIREHCDFLVKIPMLGKTESLNASVASGIFFYEVVRQCSAASKK